MANPPVCGQPAQLRNVQERTRLQTLATRLTGPEGFLSKLALSSDSIDLVIEDLSIYGAPRTGIDIFDLPEAFRLARPDGFRWDYTRIYVDDESHHHGHGHAYQGMASLKIPVAACS